MLIIRLFANKPFEYIRFVILTKRRPAVKKINTISDFLYNKKLLKIFIKPELSGKLESYEFVNLKYPMVDTPTVIHLFNNPPREFPSLDCGNYIMKGSHGSGYFLTFSTTGNFGYRDELRLMKYARSWLKKKYYAISGEFVYAYTKPLVFIEKNVLGNTALATDIKIHCNDGDAVIVQQIARQTGTLIRQTWLHENGHLHTIDMYKDDNQCEVNCNQNTVLKATALAQDLSSGLGYVRVDFIVGARNELFFVEFTFFPAGGTMPLRSKQHDVKFFELLSRNKALQ